MSSVHFRGISAFYVGVTFAGLVCAVGKDRDQTSCFDRS